MGELPVNTNLENSLFCFVVFWETLSKTQTIARKALKLGLTYTATNN
jgi:hypothetical protein